MSNASWALPKAEPLDQGRGMMAFMPGTNPALLSFLREKQWKNTVLPMTIYLAVLIIAGIVGNILVILVYVRKPRSGKWHGKFCLCVCVCVCV
jgi:hypothetical protein